jgi:hypothetical protein
MTKPAAKFFYTSRQAAEILKLDPSRILQLCRSKRLGYSTEKHGKAWVITDVEIAEFQRIGALSAGRPKKAD